jgi:hypothetical protein
VGSSDLAILRALAARPAWPLEDVLSLPGHCRGSLLKDWASHVRRRFGANEPDVVRQALGVDAQTLPDAPTDDAWVRVAHHLALTRQLVERRLGGDLLALEALVREDARSNSDRWVDRVVRLALAPRRVLAETKRIHSALYDAGEAEAAVGKNDATITWHGAPFFGEPTWRVLQVFAVRGLFHTLGGSVRVVRAEGGERTSEFSLVIGWN